MADMACIKVEQLIDKIEKVVTFPLHVLISMASSEGRRKSEHNQRALENIH